MSGGKKEKATTTPKVACDVACDAAYQNLPREIRILVGCRWRVGHATKVSVLQAHAGNALANDTTPRELFRIWTRTLEAMARPATRLCLAHIGRQLMHFCAAGLAALRPQLQSECTERVK